MWELEGEATQRIVHLSWNTQRMHRARGPKFCHSKEIHVHGWKGKVKGLEKCRKDKWCSSQVETSVIFSTKIFEIFKWNCEESFFIWWNFSSNLLKETHRCRTFNVLESWENVHREVPGQNSDAPRRHRRQPSPHQLPTPSHPTDHHSRKRNHENSGVCLPTFSPHSFFYKLLLLTH